MYCWLQKTLHCGFISGVAWRDQEILVGTENGSLQIFPTPKTSFSLGKGRSEGNENFFEEEEDAPKRYDGHLVSPRTL